MRGAALAAALLLGVPASAAGRHVVVVSIDGLRPLEYLGGSPCGEPPPHLGALMRAGIYATGVQPVLPSLTYPSHATMVTGLLPNDHGVLANARWRDGAQWYFDRSDIHAKTVYDVAHEAGLSVAIVTWPSTYGATVDRLVPEDLSSDAGVVARLRAGAVPPGLFDALEALSLKVDLLPFSDPEAGVALDAMTVRFAGEIVRRARPNLLLVHFLDLDHREHNDGPGTEAACKALRRIDSYLGMLEEASEAAGVGKDTALVVVSDHGFLPVKTMVNIPALLSEAGDAGDLVVRAADGSAALYPKDAAPGRRALGALKTNLETKHGDALRWMSAGEARKAGGYDGAAFVLCAKPGFFFTNQPDDARILIPSETRHGTHGFCPDEPAMQASFIAAGAGVPQGGSIGLVRMIDVAPTVAALLDLRMPHGGKALVKPAKPAKPH